MKKISAFVAIVLCMLCSLTACAKKPVEDKLTNYISYSHEASFVGENMSYVVIVEQGKKEEIFVDDGKVGKIVPFCTVNIIPKEEIKKNSLDIVLVMNNQKYEVTVVKDMFTGNYEKTIQETGVIDKVEIGEQSVVVKDKMADCISKADLMQIVNTEFKEQIDSGWKDNKFNKEFYIKLIRDNNNINGNHYWYVALIDGQNSFCSILIDAKTGKVLTKKTK